MLVEQRSFGQICFKNTVGVQIAAVEGIQEVSEPGMGGRRKGLKNRM